jgi:uncharacterized protein YukJ
MLKCKIVTSPRLVPSRKGQEVQYHLRSTLRVTDPDGSTEDWDSAINVGTNDSDDLLLYKLVYDFQHSVIESLKSASSGFDDLTGSSSLPALDFLRSDVLKGTGDWRDSGVMDGSLNVEPVASLLRLLQKARGQQFDVYVFGRKYTDGLGVHDVHMNQGSTGSFINNGTDDNDHNDIWQDGAVLVDVGQPEFAAYFTAFTQQLVPTDNLGNPVAGGHQIGTTDEGSLAGKAG